MKNINPTIASSLAPHFPYLTMTPEQMTECTDEINVRSGFSDNGGETFRLAICADGAAKSVQGKHYTDVR